MDSRTTAFVVAVGGWLLASLIAYVLDGSTGFGAIGLVLWFFSGRAGRVNDEHSQALTRFFKRRGKASTLIGAVGLLWFRLLQ